MKQKWIVPFIMLSGGLVLADALVRLITAFGTAQVLALPDPLWGIPLRSALLGVGIIEFAIALICLFGKKISLQSGLLAWMAINWILYRLGLYYQGSGIQCSCLGPLNDSLHLSSATMSIFMAITPIAVLIGAFAVLLFYKENSDSVIAETKIACTHCGGRLKFAVSDLGRTASCPHCQAQIVLQPIPM